MSEVVILLSGGIDSTTLAWWLRATDVQCQPLFIDYGQAAAVRERDAAKQVSASLGMELETLKVSELGRLTSNLLTSPSTSSNPLFPHRNLLFLAVAGIVAYEKGYLGIAIGVHATPRYPDCSPGFLESAQEALSQSIGQEVTVIAPFLKLSKAQIVGVAKRLGISLHDTYSCLRGDERHCGRCESCAERHSVLRGSTS